MLLHITFSMKFYNLRSVAGLVITRKTTHSTTCGIVNNMFSEITSSGLNYTVGQRWQSLV